MTADNNNKLGKMLKQRRLMIPLTLKEVSAASGVSMSHLGRIERGERFPSARILRRLAKPLGFEESELFTLADYLSSESPAEVEAKPKYIGGKLDPYVASVLAQEPLDVQRAVVGILDLLKSVSLLKVIARSTATYKQEGGDT